MPDLTIGSDRPTGQGSGFTFGQNSLRHLNPAEVHPDLITLACEALLASDIDFGVHDGGRTTAEQVDNVKNGLSMTMDSRHVPKPREQGGNGLAHAIDVHPAVKGANGETRWDGPLFQRIDKAFERASRKTGIPYAWGGRWRRFVDMPHFELPRDLYPATCEVTDAQRARAAAALAKVTKQA